MPIGLLPETVAPIDLREAMILQGALNQRLVAEGYGEIVGTKIGCTTKVMQEYLGMPHPCSGAIFDGTVQSQHGRFDFEKFHHVGVECEIAVTLGKSISPRRTPYTLKAVGEAVESVHAAIEVVDDRYVDFGKYRSVATRHDLRNAVDAAFQGKTLAENDTRAIGCYIPVVAPEALKEGTP